MSEPIPLYAQGFFHLRADGLVDQIVVFDYYDPGNYYYKLMKDFTKLDKELERLRNNMQYFLDQERVLINGEDTNPRVKHVEIGFRGRKDLAYIMFIINFSGKIFEGINTYENIYEEEEAEYDYTVYWLFPVNAKVIEADVGVKYKVYNEGRILYFKVPKGTRVGGYERIVFEVYDSV